MKGEGRGGGRGGEDLATAVLTVTVAKDMGFKTIPAEMMGPAQSRPREMDELQPRFA